MTPLKVYTDGGCDITTGKGSWAFATSKEDYLHGNEFNTTNNRMELTAIIQAIKAIRTLYGSSIIIEVISDSKYCVDGFTDWMHSWVKNDWKGKKNVDLWKQLYALRFNVNLSWVKGHSGDEMNEFVDSLCDNDR